MRELSSDINSSKIYTPRFLICNICGREFGTQSFPIHQKQCAVKHQQRGEKELPKKQKPIDLSKFKSEKIESAYQEVVNGNLTKQEFNELAMNEFSDQVIDRGIKVSCNTCGRTFTRAEGLEKHQILCGRGTKVFDLKVRKGASDDSKDPVTITGKPVAKRTTVSSNSGSRQKLDSVKKPPVSVSQNATSQQASANFCVKCGHDFRQHQQSTDFKFCPSCGNQRI